MFKSMHYILSAGNGSEEKKLFRLSYGAMAAVIRALYPLVATSGIDIDEKHYDRLVLSCDEIETEIDQTNFDNLRDYLHQWETSTRFSGWYFGDPYDVLAYATLLEVMEAECRVGYTSRAIGKTFIECWASGTKEHFILFQRFTGTWGGCAEYKSEYKYSVTNVANALRETTDNFEEFKRKYQDDFMDGFVRYYSYTKEQIKKTCKQHDYIGIPAHELEAAIDRISA